MNSFIVEFWAKVFKALSWLSIFQPIRLIFPKAKEPSAVELWVLGNLVLSLMLLLLYDAPGWRWWEWILVAYSGIRIIEIVIYQINVLMFDAYRVRRAGQKYKVHGLRRLVLLLLHNYVEVIFWFAIIYRHLANQFSLAEAASMDSYFESTNLSFYTMTTFGRSSANPTTSTTSMLIQIQAAIGLFMSILILARFIGIIPQPETADKLEKDE